MFESLWARFSYREKVMLRRLWEAFRGLFFPSSFPNAARLVASLLLIAELFGALWFGYPQTPRGQTIDLSEWELVWSDEFDGDTLDPAKWGSWYSRMPRRGGYWDKEQLLVEDGHLKIRTEYRDIPGKEGWYSGEVSTQHRFEKQYGYFECRCICPGGVGLWAAFWTLSEGMFEPPTGSAANGCEIDMFESPSFSANTKRKRDGVNQATGYDGYDGIISKGVILGNYAGKNIYTEYNTFGLEWNEHEIIFYINGVETDRLTGEWVPQVPQYLLLSVEVAGETKEIGVGGQPLPFLREKDNIEKNDPAIFPVDFIVDYVRVYDRITN